MKSFLIIGLGEFGKNMATELLRLGNEVLAVEKDEERAQEASSAIAHIEIADAASKQYISTLGVSNFDFVVVTCENSFEDSLQITSLVHDAGAKDIIARARSDVHKKFLKMAGAKKVICTERDVAEAFAKKYGNEGVYEYIDVDDGYSIYETQVPEIWEGKSISELAVRQKYNIIIIGIKNGTSIVTIPDSSYRFKNDEIILIIGKDKYTEKFLKMKR